MLCESHKHEIRQLSSIFLKYENHQNYLIFKAYVCLVQTKVYIHIQNITSPQKYMHEGKWFKGCICIDNSLDKIDIYMKLNINMKTCTKWEYKSNA